MKNLISIFALTLAMLLPVSAQEGEGYGFLNIANLVPGDVPCVVKIGGETLVPDGMKGGTYTGWFMCKNGAKTIEISLGELGKESGTIQVTEGDGKLIGIYLEPSKRTNADGKPLPPRLRIRSFPTYESKGFGLKLVSLNPEVCRIHLGSLKIEAKPYEAIEVPKWNGGGFELTCNGKPVGKISSRSEGGAFYLLVGSDPQGRSTSTLVSVNQQEVPEYLRKKKVEPSRTAAAQVAPTSSSMER